MAAATQTTPALITLEEYLCTYWRPDREFIDGRVEEKEVEGDMGDKRHGLLQMQLGFWFISHRPDWKVRVASELRTLVSETRVRLPDVAVIPEDEHLLESPQSRPLLIAIEILSPEDRITRLITRLRDFAAMGVPNIWVLDPVERTAFTFTEGALRPVDGTRIQVPNSPIFLDLPEVFAALD